jgi:hypothetical protein
MVRWLKATLIISSAIMLGGTAIAFASPLRTLRGLPAQQENHGGRRAALSGTAGAADFAQLVTPAASPRRTPAWRTTPWQG